MSKIGRDEMIERMTEDVDSWDFLSLIQFAKDTLIETYSSLPDVDLQEQYDFLFEDSYEDDDDSDEESTAPFPTVVICPNCGRENDVGQKCWWCGVYT